MDEEEYWSQPGDKRKTVRRIILAVVVVLFVIAAFLQIDTVTIEGSRHYTAREFENLLFPEPLDRNPLIFLFRENTGGSIRVPFVDRYTVEMDGLSSVHIIIYEKEIAGYIDYEGLYVYFDQDGIAVESSVEMAEDVPRVLGLSGGVIEMGRRLPVHNEAVFQAVLSVSQYMQTHSVVWGEEELSLVELIDAVYVDENACVTCLLEELQLYLGNTRNLEEKLLTMSDILPVLYGRSGTVYLDNYSESQMNPSYVFKEGQQRLNPERLDSEEFETQPAPVVTTEAVTVIAEELNSGDPTAEEESSSAMNSAGEETAGEEEPDDSFEEESAVEYVEEGEEEGDEEEGDGDSSAAAVDGDGVDDIPDDYVGGDGYSR